MVIFFLIKDINDIVTEIGAIDENIFQSITLLAQHLNLDCLSYIDYIGDSIINQKQLHALKNELLMLKTKNELFRKELNIWLNAVEEVLKRPTCYLLVNGE